MTTLSIKRTLPRRTASDITAPSFGCTISSNSSIVSFRATETYSTVWISSSWDRMICRVYLSIREMQQDLAGYVRRGPPYSCKNISDNLLQLCRRDAGFWVAKRLFSGSKRLIHNRGSTALLFAWRKILHETRTVYKGQSPKRTCWLRYALRLLIARPSFSRTEDGQCKMPAKMWIGCMYTGSLTRWNGTKSHFRLKIMLVTYPCHTRRLQGEGSGLPPTVASGHTALRLFGRNMPWWYFARSWYHTSWESEDWNSKLLM